MASCSSCGEDNPERARFCLACGATLVAARRHAAEERKVVSVLFVDLVGFTARAHAADPEDVRAVLRPYHALLRREIERYGGTVEKFIGDAVMAVFGAPVAHEDDAERAVRAALRCTQAIAERNETHPGFELAVRAGIATGEVVVALDARPEAGEGIVTGDVVNTASRLQEVAPGGGVVVGEITYRSTKRAINYEALEAVVMKGKPEPVPLWRALAAPRFGVDVSIGAATPLVGRRVELSLLEDAFARTLRESCVQLVTITGEPGVGKTRLVSEFAALLDGYDELILWRQGRSLPYGEGITFWALGEIVKAHSGILESDGPPEARDKLTAAVASVIVDTSERDWFVARLAPLVGAPAPETAEPVDRAESFTAWRRFLEEVAAQGPTVVVFEDLHWADRALLEFIDHLIEWASDVALFVVCTARTELYDRHPGWGRNGHNSTPLTLAPLTDADTARLLSTLLGQVVLPAKAHAALLERAGGNPLYAEEFVRMLFDRGILHRRGRVVTITESVDIPVPDSVHALIAARLDALSSERKALLADAAVVGKVFWDGALCAIGGRDPRAVRAELGEIAKRELVRAARHSSISGNDEYSFGHALIKDVSYSQIPRAARAHKHRAMAQWIEGFAGERVTDHAEMLAHHYEQALWLADASGELASREELVDATCRFSVLAGDRAQDLDVARAQAYYARALELLPGDHPQRAHVLLKAAIVATSAGRFDEAEQHYREALAAFIERDEITPAAYAKVQLSHLVWERGDPQRAKALLDEAIKLLVKPEAGPELASAYADQAWQAVISGRPEEGLEMADRALALAEEHGTGEAIIRALSARGMAHCDLGDVRGLDDLRAALRNGLEWGLARQTAVLYCNVAEAVAWSEGPAASFELIEEATEFCRLRGMDDGAQWARITSLDVLFELGRWDELLDVAEEILDWTLARGGSYGDSWALAREAAVLLHRGDAGSAAPLAKDFLPKGRALRDPQAVAPALVTAALIELASGDTVAALDLMEELEGRAREWPSWWRAQFLPDAVRITALGGRVDLAERFVEGFVATFARERCALVTVRAAIAEARLNLDAAADLYAGATKAWDDYGFVLERGLALLGHGRCLAKGGRPDADVLLGQARETFLRLGAHSLVAEAESWLERAAAPIHELRGSGGSSP